MVKRKRNISKIGYDHIGIDYEKFYGQNHHQISAIEWLINQLNPGSKILDIGSGTGRPTAEMLVTNNFQVFGIDSSNEMIRIARNNVPRATFFEMNMKRFRIEQTFDAITAFFSLLHIQKSIFLRTITQFLEYLNPGGYFVFSMLEGAHDDYALFLGQHMYYSAYYKEELDDMIENLNLTIIERKIIKFTPRIPNAQEEVQLYYFTKKL